MYSALTPGGEKRPPTTQPWLTIVLPTSLEPSLSSNSGLRDFWSQEQRPSPSHFALPALLVQSEVPATSLADREC